MKKQIFGVEVIYNKLGQILIKKRFLPVSTVYYYRYILENL